MRLYQEGDKGRAVCEKDGLVSSTYAYRDVPFRDGQGIVKSILVGICDRCGDVIAIPAQSAPAIKAARERAAVPVEANLPAVYLDTLDLAAYRIDPNLTPEFRKRLLLYYVHAYATDKKRLPQLVENLHEVRRLFGEAEKAGTRKRLSMKITPTMSREFESVMEATSLSKTDLLKTVVAQIHKDIVAPDKPKALKELQRLAAVAA